MVTVTCIIAYIVWLFLYPCGLWPCNGSVESEINWNWSSIACISIQSGSAKHSIIISTVCIYIYIMLNYILNISFKNLHSSTFILNVNEKTVTDHWTL
jgi:hypothetical protein